MLRSKKSGGYSSTLLWHVHRQQGDTTVVGDAQIVCSYGPRANKYERFPMRGTTEKKPKAVKKNDEAATVCMQYSTGRESPPNLQAKIATDGTIFLQVWSMIFLNSRLSRITTTDVSDDAASFCFVLLHTNGFRGRVGLFSSE